MADYELGVGDTSPPWVCELGDLLGDNPGLLNETITLAVTPVDGGDPVEFTTCAVVNATTVRYDPADDDWEAPGLFLARWKIDGIETFPSRSPLLVEVFA